MKAKFEQARPIILAECADVDSSILYERANEIDARTEGNLQRDIVSALKKTIEKENITALSAPAIGFDRRIFCIKFKEEIKTFINPVIIQAKGVQLSREKCTSFPGREFIVPRNPDITVIYQRPMGKAETRQLVGMAAFIFQHELQHLDGLLLSDFALEIYDDWDSATDEEKEEVIKEYLDSIDLREKQATKMLQEDPELKKMSDAIDYMTSVYKGETKIEEIKPVD